MERELKPVSLMFDCWRWAWTIAKLSQAGESGLVGVSEDLVSARISLHARARVAMETAFGGPEQLAQISGVPGAVRERHI